jgi:transposase InsO family protein
VARLMREGDMSARRKRRRVLTTKRDATHPVAPNTLNREFTSLSTGYQMGHRYHVYPDNSRMALFGGDPGSVFASRGGMVDVHQLR